MIHVRVAAGRSTKSVVVPNNFNFELRIMNFELLQPCSNHVF